MPAKPTLRNKRGNISIFDHFAAETISVAPYKRGDIVRIVRRELDGWTVHSEGVIHSLYATGDNCDITHYNVFVGHGYAGCVTFEQLTLLMRPRRLIRHHPDTVYDLVFDGAPTTAWAIPSPLLREAYVLRNRLKRRCWKEPSQRLQCIIDRMHARVQRRFNYCNRIIDQTIPRNYT